MSEKPGVRMNIKQWHFKLIKLVLGSAAPTPQTIHNLCPYFWLLIFSIIVCAVVVPIRGIVKVLDWIGTGINNFVLNSMTIPAATAWEEKLSDLDVYQMYQENISINKSYKKAFGDEGWISSSDFTYSWWEKKYKKPHFEKSSFTDEFMAWIATQQKAYAELNWNKIKKENNYEQKLDNWRDNLDDFFHRVSDYFNSWKNIIKWTKRFVGLVVTSVGLAATYFVVTFLGKGVLWFVENWDWQVFLIVVVALVGLAVIYIIVWLLTKWVDYMRQKGTSLWYVKLGYWIVMAAIFPIKIVFYHFLWQLLIRNIIYLIVKGAKFVWGAILGFLGIFGEYFGASYTDYCPGIEWEEEK